jgi:ribosomal-protein-alanine N-acetyltransferase
MAARLQVALQFRPMRQADVPAVAGIEERAYEFPWTAGIFRDCLGSGYHCWVAESTEGVVGYGVLSVGADEAHLLNLCIDPAWHGRGLGRRVLRRMVDLARWHMADRVFLEVRPSNPSAIALYASEGFREIAIRPRYYPAKNGREDAIVMAIELLPPDARAEAPPA